ncbi:response regulator transcription factor [Paenibacillus roseipurpureus]|uniref:Response regulator n=1 Tax=Paenibacillus roseopurpureus TaxID=2918901 RepID=A0AA96RNX9_9BACL|nr:response regulator [Paenibacillus sp. MBLB1832]WNR46027.1 response regulator [Paenibacillus sp. MBLB1832]
MDDEPLFVNGLAEALEDAEELNLEMYRAYSSDEALNWLNRTKIDIVVSDIRMPRMNGLDLQLEIKRQWPSCKVIFLTGYDDFNYAQQALRHGALDFVLKTEGDQVLMEKVKQAIQIIELDRAQEQFMAKAREQLHQSKAAVQKEYIKDILLGDKMVIKVRQQQFKELQLDLDGEEQVLLVLGKVDKWLESSQRTDRALYQFAIQNIAEEYLTKSAKLMSIQLDSTRFVWIIQPKQPDLERTQQQIRFVQGTFEEIQLTCGNLLSLKISFAIANQYVEWEQLHQQFESLQILLNQRMGLEQELLLINYQTSDQIERIETHNPSSQIKKWIGFLQFAFENNKSEAFFQTFHEIMAVSQQPNVNINLLKAEIYLSMGSLYLSNIQQWNLQEEIGSRMDLTKLTRLDQFAQWSEIIEYYALLAELIFQLRFSGWQEQGHKLVESLKHYIEDHIADDLSLTRLGEVVSHNPAYLSRLYKQLTGEGLSETISEARMKQTKRMLMDPHIKIYEIPAAVGLDSLKYFRKWFKKETNMTPQEYRDSLPLDR